jgi:hypothetical protein
MLFLPRSARFGPFQCIHIPKINDHYTSGPQLRRQQPGMILQTALSKRYRIFRPLDRHVRIILNKIRIRRMRLARSPRPSRLMHGRSARRQRTRKPLIRSTWCVVTALTKAWVASTSNILISSIEAGWWCNLLLACGANVGHHCCRLGLIIARQVIEGATIWGDGNQLV